MAGCSCRTENQVLPEFQPLESRVKYFEDTRCNEVVVSSAYADRSGSLTASDSWGECEAEILRLGKLSDRVSKEEDLIIEKHLKQMLFQ
jgi:hypothetical protein